MALGKYSPYRNMEEGIRSDRRPDFLQSDSDQSVAEDKLRSAEDNSSADLSYTSGSIEDAREAEGSFTNSVAGRSSQASRPRDVKAKIKKRGPLIAIIVLFGIGAVLIFLAQSLMPFAIVNRIIEEFNTNGISSVLRADNILDYQLSSPGDTFGMTKHQKDSLYENGILNVDYAGGTILAYSNGRGVWTAVAGTAQQSADPTAVANEFAQHYVEITSNATYSNPYIISPEDAMNDPNFKRAYTSASKTWRGGDSGWYDTLTSMNESIRGIERSRFFSLGANTANRITSQAARNIMKGRTITGSKAATSDGETHSLGSGINKGVLKAAAAVNGLSYLAGGYCTYVEVANKVQTIIQAISSMQQMNLITGFAESVQMVQAGDDSQGIAMNEYANSLTKNDPATNQNAIQSAGINAMFTGDPIDSNDESVKSATAEGAFANLSNSSNPVSNFLATAVNGTSNFLDAMTRCTYIQGSLSVVSTVLTVVGVATGGIGALVELGIQSIIGAVVSAVVTQFLDLLIDWFWDNYGEILENDLATAVIGPDLGNALVSGANKYPASNHQAGGGSPGTENQVIAFRRQQEIVIAEEAEYQRSIRSPFDITSQYTFLGAIVYNLVPMANTSGAGSILKSVGSLVKSSVTNMLPTASAIAETNLISSFGDCPTLESIGIVGDAYCNPYFISDTSTNTSVAMKEKLNEYNSIAGTSKAYAYSASTGNDEYLDPDEVIQAVYTLGGITSTSPVNVNGKKSFEIVKNSNLYKYAVYCGTRTSDWGFADANVAQQLQEYQNRHWYNKIPIIGSLISSLSDMINASSNKGWISGANCVARDYNPSCEICDDGTDCFWQNEGKYYQRFIEDERYLMSAGSTAIDSDPVTLTLNDYFEENPLDQSFEGILARYSGMTKDDVLATLDFIDAMDYIANYKPETRLAFGRNNDKSTIFFESTENSDSTIALEPRYVLYNDVRNRVSIM